MGYSWPGVFLLGASGCTGRFFTQLLFHDLISVSFVFFTNLAVFSIRSTPYNLKCPYCQNVFLGFHYLCNI